MQTMQNARHQLCVLAAEKRVTLQCYSHTPRGSEQQQFSCEAPSGRNDVDWHLNITRGSDTQMFYWGCTTAELLTPYWKRQEHLYILSNLMYSLFTKFVNFFYFSTNSKPFTPLLLDGRSAAERIPVLQGDTHEQDWPQVSLNLKPTLTVTSFVSGHLKGRYAISSQHHSKAAPCRSTAVTGAASTEPSPSKQGHTGIIAVLGTMSSHKKCKTRQPEDVPLEGSLPALHVMTPLVLYRATLVFPEA